jgi:hypothetical protein
VIFQGFLRNFGKIQIPNGFPFNTKFFFSSELKLYRTFKKISKELSERVTSNEGCTSLSSYNTVFRLQNIGWRAGGVAQVVEHLLSKCEALSSNPSTTKN